MPLMAPLPKSEYVIAPQIVVGRDTAGAPYVRIGDTELPFLTSGIHITPPSLREMASVTVTFLAENIIIEEPHAGGIRATVVGPTSDCRRCQGKPPFGFTCNTCGEIGDADHRELSG